MPDGELVNILLSRENLSVAILTASLSRNAGGLFQSVRKSSQALSKAGAEVSVFGIEDRYTNRDLGEWAPLSPMVGKTIGPSSFAYSPTLSSALMRQKFHVLHLHGIWQNNSRIAQRWGRKNDRPVVISPRGMLDPWALRNANWKKSLAKLLFENKNLEQAACIHALNKSEANAIRQFGLRNPIAIIPNGTDLPNLDGRDPVLAPDWMEKDKRKVILFLGRIHPKKGIAETINAFAAAICQSPSIADEWRLVLAGWDDGGHLKELVELVQKLGLQRHVTFPGPLHGIEKSAAFTHASAFVLASFSEGLPIAVLEAWAHSLPVFMTRECNLPNAFGEGAALELTHVDGSCAQQLSEYLRRDDLPSFGTAGRKLAAHSYSWPKVSEQLLELYNWLDNGRSTPSFVDC